MSTLAGLKLSGASQENEHHVLILRVIFAISHILFFIIYLMAKSSISSMIAMQEIKIKSTKATTDCFKSIVVRAIVISAIHYKSHIIQPLLVSSIMGFMSILENEHMHKELSRLLPFLKPLDAEKKMM